MPSLIFIDIWEWTPMIALIVLAGLVSLPKDPYEAAMIDGANTWLSFVQAAFGAFRLLRVLTMIIIKKAIFNNENWTHCFYS